MFRSDDRRRNENFYNRSSSNFFLLRDTSHFHGFYASSFTAGSSHSSVFSLAALDSTSSTHFYGSHHSSSSPRHATPSYGSHHATHSFYRTYSFDIRRVS